MMMGVMTVSAGAKTKKITPKRLSKVEHTIWEESDATTVKKGTYNVVVPRKKNKDSNFILEFKAPKTATYKFDVSNVKTSNDKELLSGTFAFYKEYDPSPRYQNLELIGDIKTQGGKNELGVLSFGNYNSNEDYSGPKDELSEAVTKKRYGKLKINKGETVYIYFNTDGNKYGYLKSFTLKIK